MKKRVIVLFVLFLLVLTPINFSYTVLGATENLNTYTEVDALGRLSMNTNGTQVNISAMQNGDDNVYLMNHLEVTHGLQTTDWSLSFEMWSPPTTLSSNSRTRLLGAGFSDGLGDVRACGTEYWCGIYVSANSPYLNRMILGTAWNTHKTGSVTLSESTWYYIWFNRSGTTLTYSMYTSSLRNDASLVETLTYTGVSTEPFKYFYAAQSIDHTDFATNKESWRQRMYTLTVDGCLQPDAPTNGAVDYDHGTTTINLTWTKGNNANNTVVRYSNTAYPTSITDGTLWYNGTLDYYENNAIDTSKFYYIRAWSESNWSSPNGYKVSTSYLQFDYGTLTIDCYDENTSGLINGGTSDNTWGIFISDSDGTETYEKLDCTNSLTLASNDIPYGTDTILVFNATNYSQRVYYYDFSFGNTYSIDAYLSPSNSSELYRLTVNNEYDQPVDDVNLHIRRYINSTTEWANVSRVKTDSNGDVYVYLMYNELYKVRINKTDYMTSTYDYIPSDLVFTKEFRILFEDVEYMNESIYHELITFTAEISGLSLFINFTCSDSNIVSTAIVVYNISNTTGVRTAIQWYNDSINNSYNLIYAIEDGMCYEVTLGLVHSIFGTTSDYRIICDRIGITTTSRFDTIFDLNFKYNPFGWSNTFGFFLLVATMFSFGQQHVGMNMLLTGGVLIFVNVVIGLALVSVAISLGIITLGIIVIYGERGVKT